MRKQNPPQASLDKALEIEKYMSPLGIAAAYALCAAVIFGLLALLFAMLLGYGVLNASVITLTVFAMILLAPAVLAIKAFRRRPHEPISEFLATLADSYRQPITIAEDRCSFKVLLMTGEAVCVNLSFYYPEENQIMDVKVRLNVFVRAALERACSMRSDLPSEREIESAIDDAMEVVAAESDMPILYMELRDVHKVRDAYSKPDDLAPSEYLGTGTHG